MKFKEKLRMLRKERGLTQAELAQALNTTIGTIQQYELGKREPNFRAIIRIENFFGVTASYLMDEIEENSFDTLNAISLPNLPKCNDSLINLNEPIAENNIIETHDKVIRRMYKLVYLFADMMLKEEDELEQRRAEFERQKKENSDNQISVVDYSTNNASVMKECMREARDATEFLVCRKSDVKEWQIAGINAMFDKCNNERHIPHDLPTAIKGLLCMHIFYKENEDSENAKREE